MRYALIGELRAHLNKGSHGNSWTKSICFRDFVYLEAFRQQLGGFLKHWRAAESLASRDDAWFAFLVALSSTLLVTNARLACVLTCSKVTARRGSTEPAFHCPDGHRSTPVRAKRYPSGRAQ